MVEDGWAHCPHDRALKRVATEYQRRLCSTSSLSNLEPNDNPDSRRSMFRKLSTLMPCSTVTKFLLSSALPCSPLQHGRQCDKQITAPILAVSRLSITSIPREVNFLLITCPPPQCSLPYTNSTNPPPSSASPPLDLPCTHQFCPQPSKPPGGTTTTLNLSHLASIAASPLLDRKPAWHINSIYHLPILSRY
jgi:hypothetical protein